jgi:hypothetical protein
MAMVTAIVAAFYWYLAGAVDDFPSQPTRAFDDTIQDLPFRNVEIWVMAIVATLRKTGKLNRIAALLTATSVILGAGASLAGALHL